MKYKCVMNIWSIFIKPNKTVNVFKIPVRWYCFILLPDNTAGIVTKRSGFRRRLQEIYYLPVVIEDNGYPLKTSTGTLTIRVCGCESDGSLLTCSAEAIFLPVGLSTGALIAILLCIIILLGEICCLPFSKNVNDTDQAKRGLFLGIVFGATDLIFKNISTRWSHFGCSHWVWKIIVIINLSKPCARLT